MLLNPRAVLPGVMSPDREPPLTVRSWVKAQTIQVVGRALV